MATYNPPQPLWKRNVAGVLDFLLALIVFHLLFDVVALGRGDGVFGTDPIPEWGPPGAMLGAQAG